MGITVTISGLDVTAIQWLKTSNNAKTAIYAYQKLKGRRKGYTWSQGADSSTFTLYARCARTSANFTTMNALPDKAATIVSDTMGTWSVYITSVTEGTYNSAWLYFTMSVIEV